MLNITLFSITNWRIYRKGHCINRYLLLNRNKQNRSKHQLSLE